MKLPLIALVAMITLAAAWAQDAAPAFDADAFFSGSGSAASPADDAAGSGEQVTTAVSPLAASRTSGLSLTGSASADVLWSILEPFDEAARTGGYSGFTTLSLDAMGGDRNEAKVEASAVVRMIYGDAASALRTSMSFELRKLYLSVYTRLADLSAGRMIINYGRGTVFSPVDLFSSVDTADLDLGRTGTDAVRVLLPLGDFSGLDLVATLDRMAGDAIAGGRLYGNLAGLDFGISAFGDGLADGSGDLVTGLDFKGDLELGISAEAVARLPCSEWEPDASEAVYSLMAGLDYSIGGAWFFDAEYLWNVRAGSATAVGNFTSDHYLFGSVSWKPDELTAIDLRCIAAPTEPSMQATLSLSRSVASGANLTGYALYRDDDASSLFLGIRLSVAY